MSWLSLSLREHLISINRRHIKHGWLKEDLIYLPNIILHSRHMSPLSIPSRIMIRCKSPPGTLCDGPNEENLHIMFHGINLSVIDARFLLKLVTWCSGDNLDGFLGEWFFALDHWWRFVSGIDNGVLVAFYSAFGCCLSGICKDWEALAVGFVCCDNDESSNRGVDLLTVFGVL